jgi:hypothetical protein
MLLFRSANRENSLPSRTDLPLFELLRMRGILIELTEQNFLNDLWLFLVDKTYTLYNNVLINIFFVTLILLFTVEKCNLRTPDTAELRSVKTIGVPSTTSARVSGAFLSSYIASDFTGASC